MRKDKAISISEKERRPIFDKNTEVKIFNFYDPRDDIKLERQCSDDFSFVINEKNLDQETFDKINLAVSSVEKDNYHDMLQKSMTENLQCKNIVNKLLKEHSMIGPETEKVK